MFVPKRPFVQMGNSYALAFCRWGLIFAAIILSSTKGLSYNQNGQVTEVYSVDWNGSEYLLTGNGLSNSPFPHLSVYENNFYVFDINSSNGGTFYIGENNQSTYSKSDVWNNGAQGSDEYVLFSPDSNTSRTLYYFNSENNVTVGQISVSRFDSLLFHPDIRADSAKFGLSSTINDWNQTIVGAPGQLGFDDGSVDVLNLETNGSLSSFQRIVPPESGQTSQFGFSLSQSGESLLISSPDLNASAGAVFVYNRENNGSYSLNQTLDNFSNSGDIFGWDISVDDQVVAISSLEANTSNSGKVSLFDKNGGAWNFHSSFSSDDNQSEDRFGFDIDLRGGRLLVGAPKADANGTDSGAAYIFERNSSVWVQTAKLSPSGLSAEDEFGYSVALQNDLAFVGARKRDGDGNATDAGIIYVFQFDGTSWVETIQINPPQNTNDQYFSSDLTINQDILAVSSPAEGEGYVYIYRIEGNGSSIPLISSLDLSEANSTDQNNLSISLSDGFAIIGIPGDSTFEQVGGGVLAFFNDAWQIKNLPNLLPIIEWNASTALTLEEDAGTLTYDFNGTHPYGMNLEWGIYPDNNSSFSVNNNSGLFTFTPDGNFSGTSSFSIFLSEGNLTAGINFDVNITAVPDAPIFNTSTLSLAMEGDAYSQNISYFDADGDSIVLSESDNSFPSWLSIDGNNLVGTPSSGSANGNDSEDYTVKLSIHDGTHSVQKTFTLTVLKRNNPPLISLDGNSNFVDLNLTLNEDFNASAWYSSLPVLGFSDPDGHQISLTSAFPPSYGTLTLDLNSSGINQAVLFEPNENFVGSDSFTIRLSDVEGEANKSTDLNFNLTVTAVNDPPVFDNMNTNLIASEGQFFEHNFTFSDPDENETHSLSFTNLPEWLEYDNNFSISQTPQWSDYPDGGSTNFSVTVTDQNGSTDDYAFNLRVIPLNYPPVISVAGSLNITIDEDLVTNTWISPAISVVDQDSNFSDLVWSIESNASHGDISISGSANAPNVDFVPHLDYFGSDTFTLSVKDINDGNSSDSITFNLVINPTDDSPIFETNSTFFTAVVGYEWRYDFTFSDSDGLNGLTVSSENLPGWLNFFQSSTSSGYLIGVPPSSAEGNHTTLLKIVDPTSLVATHSVPIEIVLNNTSPFFTQGPSIDFNSTEDTLLDMFNALNVVDPDKQKLIWSVSSLPSDGNVSIGYEADILDVLNYSPDSNFSGSDTFELTVSDGIDHDSISVTVNVSPLADSPIFITPLSYIQIIDNESFDLNMSFFDADGFQGMDASLAYNPPAGQIDWLTMNESHLNAGIIGLSGFPTQINEGNHSITITLTDSTGLNISNTLVVEVIVPNYAPVINDGNSSVSVMMTEDLPGSWIAPFLQAIDAETNSTDLVWSINLGPLNGSASIDSNGGNLNYTPDANFSGSDSFTIVVQDDGVLGYPNPKDDNITINIFVEGINDIPVFTSLPVVQWNDASEYLYQISTYDADWSTQNINIQSLLPMPSWLSFENDGNGSGVLKGLATPQDIGVYNFKFEVSDSNNSSTLQIFNLAITIDNYAPVIKTQLGNILTKTRVFTYEDTFSDFSQLLSFNATDIESAAQELSWSLSSNPTSGGTARVEGNGSAPSIFTYSPPANFSGEDSLTISVSDGERNCTLEVGISVIPTSDSPEIVSFSSEIFVKEGEDFNVSISSSDIDFSDRFLVLNGIKPTDWLYQIQSNHTIGSVVIGGIPPLGSANSSRVISIRVVDSTALTNDYESELKISIIPHDIIKTNEIGPRIINEDETVQLDLHNFFQDNSLENNPALVFEANCSNEQLLGVQIVDGNLSLFPQANLSGNCSVELIVKSGTRWLVDSFSVEVIPQDDPPFLISTLPSLEISEDSNYTTLSLNTYFADIDNDNSSISYSVNSSNASLISGSLLNDSLHLITGSNQVGTAVVSVLANSNGLSVQSDFNVSVISENDPPQIIEGDIINKIISEDLSGLTWGTLEVSALDVEGDVLNWEVSRKPQHGNYSFTSNKTGAAVSLNYIPHSNYFGQDSLILNVSDGNLSDQVEVVIAIESVDDSAFLLSQIPSITLTESSSIYRFNIANYFSDEDNNDSEMNFSASSLHPHLLEINIDGEDLIVHPKQYQNGNTVVQVDANSSGLVYTSYFNVTVVPVDDPPYLITDLLSLNVLEDSNLSSLNLSNYFKDIDSAEDAIVYTVSSNRSDILSIDLSQNILRLNPLPDAHGTSVITIDANSSGLHKSADFNVTVTAVDDPPYLATELPSYNVSEDSTAIDLNLSNYFNDIDSTEDGIVYTVSSDRSDILSIDLSQNILRLNPLPDAFGTSVITIDANSSGLHKSADFNVTVTAVDDPPYLATELPSYNVSEDSTVIDLNLSNYFSDIDSTEGAIVYTVSSDRSDILSIDLSQNILRLNPLPDAHGTSVITIDANSSGLHKSADFNVTVTAVDDPPYLATELPSYNVLEDSTVIDLNLSNYFKDIDSAEDAIVFTVSSNRSGIVSLDLSQNILRLNPLPDAHGTSVITIDANSSGLHKSADFNVTVTAVDDPPYLATELPSYNVLEDSTVIDLNLSNYFSDKDSTEDGIVYTVSSDRSDILSIDLSQKMLRLNPLPDAHGTSVITIDANSSGLYKSADFNVTVTAVDDPPYFINSIAPQVLIAGTKHSIELSSIFDDHDSNKSLFSYFSISSNPALVEVTTKGSVLELHAREENYGHAEISIELNSSGLLVYSDFNVTVRQPVDNNYSSENIAQFISYSAPLEIENWRENWFGYFSTLDSEWIYHVNFGWIFPQPSSNLNEIWFWVDSLGWLWTSKDYWEQNKDGYLFSSETDGWLFYKKNGDLNAQIYDYNSDSWSNFTR